MRKYLKQWEWPDVHDMRRNNKADPKECSTDFTGRLAVITGATSGIGRLTAYEYAAHGADLLVVNRNEEQSKALGEEIRDRYRVRCEYRIADYTRISNVKKIGQDLLSLDRHIDVLIHNAGVYSTTRQFTANNMELVFQVNYLASFILNYMLKDKLKERGKTRILLVNSEGHRFALSGIHLDDLRWDRRHYSGLVGYGAAKTAQILSMFKFTECFEGSAVTINAMHPGNVKTSLGENNGRLYRFYKHHVVNARARNPQISAKALFYLGASEELEGISGKFFNLTTEEKPAPHARDRAVAEELWKISIELGGLA
ncbi:MAG: SDR family NAD(P)-dependent oxidoreductase [Candidatus Aminicenantes bacterium]|nr:SDR family NAD(P)-dependent oxidoreductase [Candidatus Aminicenantes bacterium]